MRSRFGWEGQPASARSTTAPPHLRRLDSSMSTAPPPGTTFGLLSVRRTIMTASCSERSASSRNCSLPPRSTRVAVCAEGQPAGGAGGWAGGRELR